jgi:fumarate reductase subunit D
MTDFPTMPRNAQSVASKVIGGVIVVGVAVWVLPTVLVLVVGMAPTIVAFFTDRRREKYAAFCVGFMNMLGVLPVALGMWTRDHSMDSAMRNVTNIFNWFMMYGAAGVGWGLYAATPAIVAFFLRVQIERRITKMQGYQQELIDEWGEGVTEGTKTAEDRAAQAAAAAVEDEK